MWRKIYFWNFFSKTRSEAPFLAWAVCRTGGCAVSNFHIDRACGGNRGCAACRRCLFFLNSVCPWDPSPLTRRRPTRDDPPCSRVDASLAPINGYLYNPPLSLLKYIRNAMKNTYKYFLADAVTNIRVIYTLKVLELFSFETSIYKIKKLFRKTNMKFFKNMEHPLRN